MDTSTEPKRDPGKTNFKCDLIFPNDSDRNSEKGIDT